MGVGSEGSEKFGVMVENVEPKTRGEILLDVRGLVTSFDTEEGWLRAVDEVSFEIRKGQTLGLVGESGCGKSVTAMSLVGLLPQPVGNVCGGQVLYRGDDLLTLKAREMMRVRGGEIGVIFQEPMTALNPVHRVGRQVAEAIRLHGGVKKRDAFRQAADMLNRVGIPAVEKRMLSYPHELSGGMRQRVGIAIALACQPSLLLADEPTTALDVTVQAQILELLRDLKKESELSVLLITHDLGVIAEECDEVVVMYAGRVVERASVRELFRNPRHAYTQGLLKSMPTLNQKRRSRLPTIPGQVAGIQDYVYGCRFCQRMGRKGEVLWKRAPLVEVRSGHWVEDCPECHREELQTGDVN